MATPGKIILNDAPKPVVSDRTSELFKLESSVRQWAREVSAAVRNTSTAIRTTGLTTAQRSELASIFTSMVDTAVQSAVPGSVADLQNQAQKQIDEINKFLAENLARFNAAVAQVRSDGTDLANYVKSLNQNLLSEQGIRKTEDSVIVSQLNALVASFGSATSLFATQITTIASENLAQTTQLTTLESSLGGAYAAITIEATTRATADSAMSSLITTLTANLATTNANLSTELTVRASADSALASSITSLSASLGTTNANLTTESTTRATADTAISASVTSLSSSLGSTNASLTSEISTRASADSALSSSISSLSATVGGVSSTVNILSSAYIVGGSAIATWGFKLAAGNKVVGMQAIAASGGTQADTATIIFSGADLQSDNYVADTSGWKIAYNGDIFGNDAMLRGTLRASRIDYGPLIGAAGPGASAVMDWEHSGGHDWRIDIDDSTSRFRFFNTHGTFDIELGTGGNLINTAYVWGKLKTDGDIILGNASGERWIYDVFGNRILRSRYSGVPASLGDVIAVLQWHGLSN